MTVAARQPAPEMTPGRYLRLCREAAGVTIPQAARAYAHSSGGARNAELLLEEAERDLLDLADAGLRRLQALFRLDVAIYLALAEGGLPVPAICLRCGGTRFDPCPAPRALIDSLGMSCPWWPARSSEAAR